LLFKGTARIGTADYAREREALTEVEKAYQEVQEERRKGIGADEVRLDELQRRFDGTLEEASPYSRSEEFAQVIERNGGVGLNASTSAEATLHFCSLPSNRTELWFYLESERFLQPVYRELLRGTCGGA
jgi:predicted Zn-dependent peptidase